MKHIIPPVWLLIAILLMTVLHFTVPVREVVPMPVNLSGLVLVAVGLLIFGWAVQRIRRAQTTIKPFQESSTLITSGPFRVSRNPIYLSMVLLLLGVAVLFGSLTPLAVVPIFAVLIDRVFIQGEQLMLQATFGKEYERYLVQVRRWL